MFYLGKILANFVLFCKFYRKPRPTAVLVISRVEICLCLMFGRLSVEYVLTVRQMVTWAPGDNCHHGGSRKKITERIQACPVLQTFNFEAS